MSQTPDERGAEMRDLFFETAQDLLQTLNDDALKLEKSPDDAEILRSMRRTVHTLKGDAAACGFGEMSELAHLLEDGLAADIRNGLALVEIGLIAADVFNAMLGSYRGKGGMPDDSTLRDMIHELADGASASGGNSSPTLGEVIWTEYEKLAAANAYEKGNQVFHVTAHIDPLCSMPIAARQVVSNAISAMAEILGARPEPGFTGNAKTIDLLIATQASEVEIVAKCRIPTIISQAECLLVPASAGIPSASPPANETPPAGRMEAVAAEHAAGDESSSSGAENILRVDAERIDNVINLVGELVIAKSMMQQVVHEFARNYPKDVLRTRFTDAIGFQVRVLNDLQRSVMKVRMVPVEQLFRRFPRMVRDVTKRCEKQAKLIISGEDTDLDKSLLDAIAEPLTHIVRNAVSHGLETPGERERLGKPAEGEIQLDAYHQGNQLIVEVSDDGRGIDISKVKAKAIKGKMITADEADRLSQAEILDLIFRPGFSTADEVTEISGRGVGLDVVRSIMHRLKGVIELETHPGKGTTFRLKLPLTLAIIKALLFRVERRLYAIPLNAVAEIARAQESDLHVVDSCEVMQLRGQAVPLVRMGKAVLPDVAQRNGKIFVLLITYGDRKLGLIVDALEGEEELVIKSLDDQSIATDLVSGASILGDGRVVLIVNLAAIMERFTRRAADIAHAGLLLSENERQARAAAAGVRP